MFRRKRKGQRDPFNEALAHYRQLHSMDDPCAYREGLAEIVRLCQLGIQKQKGNGDAYVLLANAYLLAAGEVRPKDGSHYEYFLSRACAVAFQWASGGFGRATRMLATKFYKG
jgi:hypothetical protein